MILESHFSLGSGGGVPAIGCGLGRVAVPVLLALVVGPVLPGLAAERQRLRVNVNA